MGGFKTRLMQAGLRVLHRSRLDRLLAPVTEGRGLILTLHHVRPEREKAFAPNKILEVTPAFLEGAVAQVLEVGLDVITLDEAAERLRTGKGPRFACFTFDDGYRDNAVHALPIFRRFGVPMTIYVPTDFPDRKGELWWVALEAVVDGAEAIAFPGLGRLASRTLKEKDDAFRRIYWRLRAMAEDDQREAVRSLCSAHGVDQAALCGSLIMDWDALRELAQNELVTLGAHTKGHYAIAKLDRARALDEMGASADRLENEIGRRPAHFSFPYGDPSSAAARDFGLARELGFTTAVTTRKGMIFPEHRDHLTALPRVSLNGDYQSSAYTSAFLTGAPFALNNRFRRVNAA